MPHTGQSYHSTSHTFNPITVSHNTHTHTHRCEAYTSRSEQTLCFPFFLSHTLSHTLSFLRGQKTKPVPHVQNPIGPFSERMSKGISCHQPNSQVTARVGKRGKLNVYWGKIHAGGSRTPSCVHGRGVRSAFLRLRTEHPTRCLTLFLPSRPLRG